MSLDKNEKENEENLHEEEHKEKSGEDTTLIELGARMSQGRFILAAMVCWRRKFQVSDGLKRRK